MPPPQQPKRRGRPSKKQIAEREGKLAEYEASEKSSKKKQVRWDDGYHSKAAMDDDLGDKADDDDENFKDGQELKDDGTLRKNPVGFDEYLSKIGVEPAENDEQMTGSIKSFCQKRRKVVYESINKDTEEEERFSAHIEAFGHKMRAKVETVSDNLLMLISCLSSSKSRPYQASPNRSSTNPYPKQSPQPRRSMPASSSS